MQDYSKHNAGPWEVKGDLIVVAGTSPQEHDPEAIAKVLRYGGTRPADANGRLIASAPKMLEALREVANSLYALRDHAQEQGLAATVEQRNIDLICAVIAEAEGKEKKLDFAAQHAATKAKKPTSGLKP